MALVLLLSTVLAHRLSCPSCGQVLQPSSYKRHLAFCAPEHLDPDGWPSDREHVLAHLHKRHKPDTAEFRALSLRFGDDNIRHKYSTHTAICDYMGWSPRKTRDTISSFLHSVPLVADVEPLLEVLFEDDSYIIVSKPAGVGVTPEHRFRGGSMQNMVFGHLQQQQRGSSTRRRRGDDEPRPCHRLDLNTSGVLAFAKTAPAATALMSQFEERLVRKSYAALCDRSPTIALVDADICRVEGVNHAERRLCMDGARMVGRAPLMGQRMGRRPSARASCGRY